MSIVTEPVRYLEAINAGIADAMERDDSVVLIGIDVGAGGGIFTVTKGLYERFGSGRVIDTPISEMGYVGAAVGAAMTGLRPIVEIMFMDFIGVCLDPILNQAAKLPYMTAGALQCPIVFRTQTGAGRSAGAQHSQSLETMLAHVPGLRVVMPATVTDAHDLLVAAVEDPNPVVFIESRRLYGMRGPTHEDPLPLGKARIAVAGNDVTVVTWGQMLRECLKAAEDASVSIEVDRSAVAGADGHGDRAPLGGPHRQASDRARGGPGFRRRRGDRRSRRRGALRRAARSGPPHRRADRPDAVQPRARASAAAVGNRRGRGGRSAGARGLTANPVRDSGRLRQ